MSTTPSGLGYHATIARSILSNIGYQHSCPICKMPLRRFLPLDRDAASDILIDGEVHRAEEFETINLDMCHCPVCGATDRTRLYALYMDDLLRSPRGRRIHTLIHFGPKHEASFMHYLRKKRLPNYRTADLYDPETDDRIDISDMYTYMDGSVDFFICSHILEHVADDRKAIRELYRILTPGGEGILMSPILSTLNDTYEDFSIHTKEDRRKHFGDDDHVRVYARQDFLRRVEEAGFVVRALDQGHFGEQTFRRCGIASTSTLYVVGRPDALGAD